jgi:hypothetical protein
MTLYTGMQPKHIVAVMWKLIFNRHELKFLYISTINMELRKVPRLPFRNESFFMFTNLQENPKIFFKFQISLSFLFVELQPLILEAVKLHFRPCPWAIKA